ncbi:MAG: hypothetical protein ACRDRL_24625 [Sciscionella sp.]
MTARTAGQQVGPLAGQVRPRRRRTAEAAARAALAAHRTGTPQQRDGQVEALRSLGGPQRPQPAR